MEKLNNPILFFIFCLAVTVNIWDLVTSILIGSLESNPLYVLFGNSIIPVIAIKVLIVYSFWWFYNIKVYKTNFTYYTVVSIIVMITILIGVASAINTYGLTQPDVMVNAASFTSAEKTSGYITFVSLGYIIPMTFNLLIFWVYEKTRKNVTVLKK